MLTRFQKWIRKQRINAIVRSYKKFLKATTNVPEFKWNVRLSIVSDNKYIHEREKLIACMTMDEKFNRKYGFN